MSASAVNLMLNNAEQLSLLIKKLRKTKNIADDDSSKQFPIWAGMSMDNDSDDRSDDQPLPQQELRNIMNPASTSSSAKSNLRVDLSCSKSSDNASQCNHIYLPHPPAVAMMGLDCREGTKKSIKVKVAENKGKLKENAKPKVVLNVVMANCTILHQKRKLNT